MSKYLNSIELLLARIWNRILDSGSVDTCTLVSLRITFGVFILLFSAPYFSWINQVPQGLFEPPILSVANFFKNFPPNWILFSWDIATLLLAVCITFGIKTRITCLTFAIGNIIAANFSYSFGKIDHDILFRITPLLLAFTNWGTRAAIIPDKPIGKNFENASLGILALIIAFGMFTAGLEKAYVWLDFDLATSGFFSWFYSGYYSLDRQALLAPIVLNLPPQIFELADYGAVAFEISGLLFLLSSKRAWQLWLIIACVFHLLNTLLLNIGFIEHSLVYIIFLAPIIGANRSNSLTTKTAVVFGFIAIACAILHIKQRLTGIGSEYLFFTEPKTARIANLYSSLIIWGSLVPVASIAWCLDLKRNSIKKLPTKKLNR